MGTLCTVLISSEFYEYFYQNTRTYVPVLSKHENTVLIRQRLSLNFLAVILVAICQTLLYSLFYANEVTRKLSYQRGLYVYSGERLRVLGGARLGQTGAHEALRSGLSQQTRLVSISRHFDSTKCLQADSYIYFHVIVSPHKGIIRRI